MNWIDNWDDVVLILFIGMVVGAFVGLHFFGVDNSCCGLTGYPGQIWGYP